jgi:hypothetical protein
MRSKIKKSDKWIVINTTVQFDDGSIISNKYTNMYKACYGQHLGFRESCYTWSYAKLPRVSDIPSFHLRVIYAAANLFPKIVRIKVKNLIRTYSKNRKNFSG